MFQNWLVIKTLFDKLHLKRSYNKTSQQVWSGSIIGLVIAYFLKFVVLLFFGAIIIIPFYYMFTLALVNDEVAVTGRVVHLVLKPQWNNFSRAFENGYFRAVSITTVTTILAVILKIFFAATLGYAFALKQWRGKKIIWFFFFSLLALPDAALLVGQFQIITNLKWNQDWWLIVSFVMPSAASIFTGFMFRNAFIQIPDRMKEAAMIDGASELKYFLKVALPMITPTIWTASILTAFGQWNAYLWPALITGGNQEFRLISLWMFGIGIDKNDIEQRFLLNLRMSGTILAILPMIIVYFIFRSGIMRAISRQANTIKG